MTKYIFFILLFNSLLIYSQQSSIVSLDTTNVWIYEINESVNRNQTIKSDCYSVIYKIIGDTLIDSKNIKLLEKKIYKNYVVNISTDYWFSDSTIYQMNWYSSGIGLRTFYDKNRLDDSSWSSHTMGGDYSGTLRKTSTLVFDSLYTSDITEESYSGPGAHGSSQFIIAEKFGPVTLRDWGSLSTGNNYEIRSTQQILVGAQIDGAHFGKLTPPHIVNWNINEQSLDFDFHIDAINNLESVNIYNYDSTNYEYRRIDSIVTSSTHVNKVFNVGSYNLKITYKNNNSDESSFSNKLVFAINQPDSINQPDTIKSDSTVILPSEYILFQNYPNPFNPSTTLSFLIPKTNFVKLKVYDLLGRELETLLNEEKSPGNYKVEFNGEKYSSGIYFYRIQAGSFTETKKLILMK